MLHRSILTYHEGHLVGLLQQGKIVIVFVNDQVLFTQGSAVTLWQTSRRVSEHIKAWANSRVGWKTRCALCGWFY